jgi:hypothetical protein
MNTRRATCPAGFALVGAIACACSGASDPLTRTGAASTPLNLSSGQALQGQCVSATFAPVQSPLALEVLMDQSTSMGDVVSGGITKWDAVSNAVANFVQSPASAGAAMGIQYFGLTTGVATNGALVESCKVTDYAIPDVPIGALPGNGKALVDSLAAHAPSTTTPTQPALEGAIDYERTWASAHTDSVPAIVLATDGEPYDCSSTVDGTEAIAARGAAGTPRVLTFVIGIGDQSAALDGIAQAGGTGQAFYVDTSGVVSDEFLAALSTVRGSPRLACSFAIPQPDAGAVDLTRVNVTFGTGGTATGRTVIGNVSGSVACSANTAGWYFAPKIQPTSIQLCPSTCEALRASPGTIEIALGCKTQPAITQ